MQRPEVKEGAANVAVGGADQAADLDFVAAGQHQRADGVARDGDERDGKQPGQQPHAGAPDDERGLQALGPLAVEVGFGHPWQPGQIGRHPRQFLARPCLGAHHPGVRQRVLRQTGGDVGQILRCAERGERVLFGHITGLRDIGLLQPPGDGLPVRGRRIGVEKNADFRLRRQIARQPAEIAERQIQPAGQADRHAHRQCGEQGGDRLDAQAVQGGDQRMLLMAQPADHAVASATLP